MQKMSENEIVPARPDNVVTWLATKKQELGMALGKAIPQDYFLRCAATAIRRVPALAKCNRTSLWMAIFESAQCHLPVGDGTHRSCIVPYKGEAQFQIQYEGLTDLAYRSGQVKSIAAEVVYPEDKFRWNGPSRPVEHEPPWDGDQDIEKALGAYAQAEMLNGGWRTVRMSAKEIIAIKKRSAAFQRGKGPWCDKDFEPRMWRKTVLRRLSKDLPKSIFPVAIHSQLEREDARDFMSAREAEIIVKNPAPADADFAEEPGDASVSPPAGPPAPGNALAEAKAALQKELSSLPPDVSDRVLFEAGIDTLGKHMVLKDVQAALKAARELVAQ